MRVLFDTNILVTILSRREAVLAFKKDVLEKRIINISSQHILGEVEVVLAERMQLTKQKAKAAARLLARQSIVVSPTAVEKVSRDPFDDYILAAAFMGRAKYLVTEDKDLLVLGSYKGVQIVRYAVYFDALQQSDSKD